MKKITFNHVTNDVVSNVSVKIYKENYGNIIILEDNINILNIIANNCLIQIKNSDDELQASSINSLEFNDFQFEDHFIVISKVKSNDFKFNKLHPLQLVQNINDIKLIELALNNNPNIHNRHNVKLLSEIMELEDEDLIYDCKALLICKRKLIALNNVCNNFVHIGLRNPIIWSQIDYDTICELLINSGFRNGENDNAINKKIAAIPSNVSKIDKYSNIIDAYINEGKIYFDILNKYGLAL